MDSSQSSRSTTLLIPAFFGLYLHVRTLRRVPVRYAALVLYVALLLPLPSHTRIDLEVARWFTDGKQVWEACYLRIEDIERCNSATGFAIYPTLTDLQARLAYLKQHQLNLFAPP